MLLIETNGFEEIFLYWVFFLMLGKKVVSLFQKLWKMVGAILSSFLEFMLFWLLKGQPEICSKLLACRCSVNFPSFLKCGPLPLIGVKTLFTNSIFK